MKRVTVNVVNNMQVNKRESFEILCDDDVDNYDIMTHYEEMCHERDWIITDIIQSRGTFKIYGID